MNILKNYFTLGVLLIGIMGYSQYPNDCNNYIQICGSGDINLDVNGSGSIQEVASCGSGEHNSLWLRVTIEIGGTLGFILTPGSSSINEDYDFWVFGPNVSCNNLGNPIRCSTTNPVNAGLSNNLTGMNAAASDTHEGPASNGNSFVHWLDTLPGQSYYIVIDRPVGNSDFNLSWIGSAQINNPFLSLPQPFNPIPPIKLCDNDGNGFEMFNFSVLDNNFYNGNVGFVNSYYDNIDDATVGANPLVGDVEILEGTYYVRTLSEETGCFEISEFTVEFGGLVITPSSYGYCDDDDDGIVSIDLSTYNFEIFPPNAATITFFESENNAINNINPIDVNQDLTPGTYTFYIRAEDPNNDCIGVSTIEFVISAPIEVQNSSIEICDTDDDLQLPVNLNDYINQLVISNNYTSIEFYPSLADAQAESNAITNPANYIAANGEMVFYKFKNENCESIANMSFTISQVPVIEDFEMNICDENGDGTVQVDLSTLPIDTNPATGVTFSYFNTLNDAENNVNPINTVQNLTPGDYNFFIRGEIQSDICIEIAEIAIGIQGSIELQSLDVEYCDENNNGTNPIDLSSFINQIAISNNYTDIKYYNSLQDAENQENEITNFSNYLYENNETVYYRFNNESCVNITFVHFNLYTYPEIDDIVLNYCNNAGSDFYPLNLETEVDYNILPSDYNFSISFYDSLPDAENETNAIDPNIDAVNGANYYYIRVNTAEALCYNIAEIEVNIQTPMEISDVNTFEFCDDDYDGLFSVDLSSFNSDVVLSTNYTGFQYFQSEEDAENGVNSIDNYTNYPVSDGEVIYFKYYNESCNLIVPITFTVFPKPNLGEDEEIMFCPEQAPITLSVESGFESYSWSHDINETGPSVEVSETGIYTVTVTNEYGCEDEKIFNLTYLEFPVVHGVTVNENTAIVDGTGPPPIYFSIDDGQTWQTANEFYNLAPGVYYVIMKREEGCITDPFKFIIISIPNTFTPNDDGINDTWNIPFLEEYGTANISIYDRYGKAVYSEIVDNLFRWDGKFLGRALPSTTYWYVIDLPDQKPMSGWVLLKNRNND